MTGSHVLSLSFPTLDTSQPSFVADISGRCGPCSVGAAPHDLNCCNTTVPYYFTSFCNLTLPVSRVSTSGELFLFLSSEMTASWCVRELVIHKRRGDNMDKKRNGAVTPP